MSYEHWPSQSWRDLYRDVEDDFYWVPTAEVPVTNMYREEILDGLRAAGAGVLGDVDERLCADEIQRRFRSGVEASPRAKHSFGRDRRSRRQVRDRWGEAAGPQYAGIDAVSKLPQALPGRREIAK